MVENKKISILIDSFIPYVLRFYLSMTTQVYSASVFKVILIYLKVFMYYLQTGLDLFIPFSKNKINNPTRFNKNKRFLLISTTILGQLLLQFVEVVNYE